MTPRLQLRNITKRYPGIVANDHVSMEIAPGEVLAVLGENGAGKSTLMKIIYGATTPDEGEIVFDGVPLAVSSPAEARDLGIAMVHQHFALFETLTVTENVALGLAKGMTLEEIASEVRRLGENYGLEVDPESVVHDLSMGERQRVEIIRALMTRPKLLILDEPTSVLTPQSSLRKASPFSLSRTSSTKSASSPTAASCFAPGRSSRPSIRRKKRKIRSRAS